MTFQIAVDAPSMAMTAFNMSLVSYTNQNCIFRCFNFFQDSVTKTEFLVYSFFMSAKTVDTFTYCWFGNEVLVTV